MLTFNDFFPDSKEHQVVKSLGKSTEYVWEIIDNISSFIETKLANKQVIKGTIMEGAHISENSLYIGEGALIQPGAYIEGPAFIGKNVQIRTGAYIRANTILLEGSLVGNSSEIKNSLLLPGSHAPHFNYVGDSILGTNANLGAGTKLSNLTVMSKKSKTTGKRPTIKLMINDKEYDTGLSKMGAILGDNVQTGCNSVLNPGCIIAPNTLIYANISLKKGYYPPDKIIKLRQDVEIVDRL